MAKTKDKATPAEPQKHVAAPGDKVTKTTNRGKATSAAATKKKPVNKAAPELDQSIRCICGNQEAEPEDPLKIYFISCTTCNCWQHNICMGFWDNNKDLPPEYHCENCRPEDHLCLTQYKTAGEGKKWAQIRLDTFPLDAKDKRSAAVKHDWAVNELMPAVRSFESLYDYWCVPLQNVSKIFSPAAEKAKAAIEKEKLVGAIERVLKLASFAEVEKLRKLLLLRVHDKPVSNVEDMFNNLRKLLNAKMLDKIRDEYEEQQDAEVRYFFGKPM